MGNVAKEETLKNQLCPIHNGNAFFLAICHCIFCSTFWVNQVGKVNIAVVNYIAIPPLHTTAKGVNRNIENIVGIFQSGVDNRMEFLPFSFGHALYMIRPKSIESMDFTYF